MAFSLEPKIEDDLFKKVQSSISKVLETKSNLESASLAHTEAKNKYEKAVAEANDAKGQLDAYLRDNIPSVDQRVRKPA